MCNRWIIIFAIFILKCYTSSPSKCKSTYKISEGESVTLLCCNNLHKQWRFRNQYLSKNRRIQFSSNGDLILPKVRKDDFGNYTCVTSSTSFIIQLQIKGNDEQDYNMHHDHAKHSGDEVLLKCDIKAHPTKPAKWQRKKGTIDLSRANITREGLRFRSITVKDSGTYICFFDNSTKNESHRVEVFSKETQYFSFRVGKRIVLPCRFSSIIFSIWWQLPDNNNGMLLYEGNSDDRFTVTDGNLIISETSISDSGNYSCNGYNSGGFLADKVVLKIQDFKNTIPPYIVKGPLNASTILGGSVDFSCVFYSEDGVSAKWMFRRASNTTYEKLVANDRMIISENKLSIQNAKISDEGFYLCTLSSLKSQAAFLTVSVETLSFQQSNEDNLERLFAKPRKPNILYLSKRNIQLLSYASSNIICSRVEYFCESDVNWRIKSCIDDDVHYIDDVIATNQSCTFALRQKTKNGFGEISEFYGPVWFGNTETEGYSPPKLLLDSQAINSTSIILFWETNYNQDFQIEYNVKLKDQESVILPLNDAHLRSHVIASLQPDTAYVFRVVSSTTPSIKSKPIIISTVSSLPLFAPSNVFAAIVIDGNFQLISVSWDPAPNSLLHEHIAGYFVVVKDINNRTVSKLSTFSNITEVLVKLPIKEPTKFFVSVAAFTPSGQGPFSHPFYVKLDFMETLSFLDEPWFLALVGVCLWLLLFLICIIIYQTYHKNNSKFPDIDSRDIEMEGRVNSKADLWGSLPQKNNYYVDVTSHYVNGGKPGINYPLTLSGSCENIPTHQSTSKREAQYQEITDMSSNEKIIHAENKFGSLKSLSKNADSDGQITYINFGKPSRPPRPRMGILISRTTTSMASPQYTSRRLPTSHTVPLAFSHKDSNYVCEESVFPPQRPVCSSVSCEFSSGPKAPKSSSRYSCVECNEGKHHPDSVFYHEIEPEEGDSGVLIDDISSSSFEKSPSTNNYMHF